MHSKTLSDFIALQIAGVHPVQDSYSTINLPIKQHQKPALSATITLPKFFWKLKLKKSYVAVAIVSRLDGNWGNESLQVSNPKCFVAGTWNHGARETHSFWIRTSSVCLKGHSASMLHTISCFFSISTTGKTLGTRPSTQNCWSHVQRVCNIVVPRPFGYWKCPSQYIMLFNHDHSVQWMHYSIMLGVYEDNKRDYLMRAL